MKKMIFVLASLAASYASAFTSQPTLVACNFVQLTDAGARSVAAVTLNCEQKDFKVLGTKDFGVVAFTCENTAGRIGVSVRLPLTDVTLSSGRSLPATEASEFSTYYATVDEALMVSCRN
ncbi:MAG: hypothetical protein JSU04_18860 [Bdellovibrionales bacterium]|nr:hypothetical protein [Bdellovibrionales bacterium]